jgi:hypothetical protein
MFQAGSTQVSSQPSSRNPRFSRTEKAGQLGCPFCHLSDARTKTSEACSPGEMYLGSDMTRTEAAPVRQTPNGTECRAVQLAVLLKGTLRGMERECPCDVLATRHVLEGLKRDTYSDLRLLAPPTRWPDGDYLLDLSLLSARVHRRNGQWAVEEALSANHNRGETIS